MILLLRTPQQTLLMFSMGQATPLVRGLPGPLKSNGCGCGVRSKRGPYPFPWKDLDPI